MQFATFVTFSLVLVTSGCATQEGARGPLSAPVIDKEGLATLAHGHPIVIDFFAAWCRPCREVVPEMVSLARRFDPDRLTVVGIDVGENEATAIHFAREMEIPYPVFRDPEFHLADLLGATRVPTILVLDGQGHVVHRADRVDTFTVDIVGRLIAAVASSYGPKGTASSRKSVTDGP